MAPCREVICVPQPVTPQKPSAQATHAAGTTWREQLHATTNCRDLLGGTLRDTDACNKRYKPKFGNGLKNTKLCNALRDGESCMLLVYGWTLPLEGVHEARPKSCKQANDNGNPEDLRLNMRKPSPVDLCTHMCNPSRISSARRRRANKLCSSLCEPAPSSY